MLLAIEQGNTNTLFAVHDGERWAAQWRTATESTRTADEYAAWLNQFLALQGLTLKQLDGCIVSTVVPQSLFNLRNLSRRYLKVEPLVIGENADLGIQVRIDKPAEAGADRLVNAVGAFAAYYLGKVGAKLVATSTRGADGFRVAIAEEGLDIPGLIAGRDGTHLGKPRKTSPIFKSEDAAEIYDIEADIFVPAAASHTVDAKRIKQLRKAGVRVWSCGANNPFSYKTKNHDIVKWVEEMSDLQRKADKHFAIIPDFVANCGMARTFAYLMASGAKTDQASILADTASAIDTAIDRILKGHDQESGLLAKGYETFLTE